MRAWKDMLRSALNTGVRREDRTGVGTFALFGAQLTLRNTATEFPAVTTKRLAFGQVAAELASFLRGAETLQEFRALGCNIWDGNGEAGYWLPRARLPGDLGRIYGVQWRRWRAARLGSALCSPTGTAATVMEVDQLEGMVASMLAEPFSRRHLVTAWNPGELDIMCLPPCHVMFQAFVYPGDDALCVDLRVDMRSVDLFLGLPFDIASYALLQRLLAATLEARDPERRRWRTRRLVFHLGDAHVYLNHQDQVREVLDRSTRLPPVLDLDRDAGLFDFLPTQARLCNYDPHPAVKAPLNI